MKGKLLGALLAVVACTAVAFTFSSADSSAGQAEQTPNDAQVSASKGSDEGTEVYHFIVYPAWPGAEQRVIAFYGASVTAEGLVSLASLRTTDGAAAAEPLDITGESYSCRAQLVEVSSWADVRERGDVELVLIPR